MGGVRWREVLGVCADERPPSKCKHMVVDMCSETRSQSGGKAMRSVYSLARCIMARNLKVVQEHGFLFNMYDDASRMHEERESLWEERYKKKPLSAADAKAARDAGKSIVGGTVYAPHDVPYTPAFVAKLHTRTPMHMHRMWPSAHGKTTAMALFEAACMEVAHGLPDHAIGGRTIVSWHRNERAVYPYTAGDGVHEVADRCTSNTFGEADQKVSEAVKVLACDGTVCVKTVDSDMILQLIASARSHEWHPVYLHMKNATLRVHDAVVQCGGTDYNRRLTCVFWILAAHGVDYCKSLVQYGFYAKELLRHAQPTNSAFPSPALFVDGDVLGTKIFRTHALMDTLASVKRRKAKRATWGSVAEELQAMLFCVSLFTGACANRVPCGGPVKANIVITTDACRTDTVTTWSPNPHTWGDVTVTVESDSDHSSQAHADKRAKSA